MKTVQIEIPDWTAEQLADNGQALGISTDELIRALVCSNVRAFEPLRARHFTVPASMAELFPTERFMVVRRQDDSITLAPTDYVPFEEAIEAFRANGLDEDQILEIISK